MHLLDAADVAALRPFFVPEAPPNWLPVLRELDVGVWNRVVAVLPPSAVVGRRRGVRRLGASDAAALAALPPDLAWIHETWGGAEALAAAGVGWAAFAGELADDEPGQRRKPRRRRTARVQTRA